MARSRTGEGRDQYPLFQLWRPSGTEEYERVYESSSDGGEFTASEEPGITIGEYLPHDPVPFHSGDVLGVYQPGNYSDSRQLFYIARFTSKIRTSSPFPEMLEHWHLSTYVKPYMLERCRH